MEIGSTYTALVCSSDLSLAVAVTATDPCCELFELNWINSTYLHVQYAKIDKC